MYNTMNPMEKYMSYTIDKNKCLNSPNSCVKSTTSTTKQNVYEIYNYVCDKDAYSEGRLCEAWSPDEYEENNDDDEYMYKSVIIDKHTRDIYGFSPPKSVNIATFVSKYLHSDAAQIMCTDTYLINDIIEGIMVNLWYDFFAETWEISTRYSVGGMNVETHIQKDNIGVQRNMEKINNLDVNTLSVLEMFLEAIGGTGTLQERMEKISEQYRWQKSYSYHFILQHPQMIVHPPNSLEPHHPIAGSIHEPYLYLVSVYYIIPGVEETDASTTFPNVYYIPQTRFQLWEELQIPWLKFPRYITADIEYSSLSNFYSSVQSDIQFTGAGVMITHMKTGTRTKLVSAIYQEYRELRSNNMPLLFQYLCLKHVNRLDHFLQYFTIYYPAFLRFEQQYMSLLHHIHNSYLNKYVYRNCYFTPRYESTVDCIHQHIYLKNRKISSKFKITLPIVKSYIDSLTPMNLMYLLDARSIVTI